MPEIVAKNPAIAGGAKTKNTAAPRRLKDEHSESNHMVEGLSDEMKAFYGELTTIFPEIRVTSGKRDTSPSGNFSHHHTGDAIDIGKEHTDVYDYLYNTKEGLSLLDKYGLGILDETDPRNMEKTRATGPHFHIGKDSGLHDTIHTRYTQYESGIEPMQSFYSQNMSFDYSKPSEVSSANLNLYGNYNPEAEITLGDEFKLIVPNQQVAEVFMGEIKKEQEKEDYKEEKTQESEYRKALSQKQKEEQDKIDKVFSTMNKIRSRDEDSLSSNGSSADYSINPVPQQRVEIQKSLPNLPSIFNMQ